MSSNSIDINKAEALLGLASPYDEATAKKRYRDLIRENHPDAVVARGGDKGAAEARMAEIHSAYDVIVRNLNDTHDGPGTGAEEDAGRQGADSPAGRWQSEYEQMMRERRTRDDWHARYGSYPGDAAGEARDEMQTPGQEPAGFPETASRQPAGTPITRLIRAMFGKDWPWRIVLFIVSGALLTWLTGGGGSFAEGAPILEDVPEVLFLGVNAFLISVANLFAGSVTRPACDAVRWFADKLDGMAYRENNFLASLAAHFPYRLAFLAFSIWYYSDLAANPVDDPFAWPFRVIVFMVASVNVVLPFLTDALRRFLIAATE